MTPFRYEKPTDAAQAVAAARQADGAKYLAGGTNLVDLMRETIERPQTLVDVSDLSGGIQETAGGGLVIGAGVKNTAVATHRGVRERFPLLAQAILSGASGQIRNMASVGGNLMQRTRCYYFYDDAARCNKREPGAGCDAIGGLNRIHAILGASEHCVATHPSDMCVALAALDATVRVEGPQGARTIKLTELHRLPGDTPHIETALQAGELITAVELGANRFAARSSYRKVRDRASYAFALVSVAAALDLAEDGTIREARLALGGVAHKPWRATAAEAALVGAPAVAASFERAAEAELAAARGLAHNAFKIDLARRVIVNSLTALAQGQGAVA
ncbi:MAG: yagS [Phenylobacterium sp.]|nr:yagS [Phenylobacterium sp.]